MEKKSNTCGIVGLSLGWLIPLVGIILGIISLARKEDSVTMGVLSIISAVFFWALWVSVIFSGF